MAKQILFLHSADVQGPDSGSGELVTYLRRELGADYRIANPMMPNPESPDYKVWKGALEKQLDLLDDELFLIGHSLGGSVLLKYFSEVPTQKSIAGLFVVAAPFWKNDSEWSIPQYILRQGLATRLSFIPEIYFYQSRDDEVVPLAHLARYGEELPESHLRILDHYGHIFSHGLPELVSDIKQLTIS